MSRPELILSDAALVALTAYAWPGNIRELENVIHNAVLLAKGPAIEPSELKLVREASAAGLRTARTTTVPASHDDVGSEVVILRA